MDKTSSKIIFALVAAASCVIIAKNFTKLHSNIETALRKHVLTKSLISGNGGEELAPCGEVCTYGGTIMSSDQRIPKLLKNIDCENIMKRMAYKGHNITYPPPGRPPKELHDEFSQYGECLLKYFYRVDFKPGEVVNFHRFDAKTIIDLINKPRNANYGGTCMLEAVKSYAFMIKQKKCVVIGTQLPWLEAMLLSQGAGHVTTLEYGQLIYEHAQMDAMTPYTYAEQYLLGNTSLFDFGASFSSLEHSGLGRYGDPLNPYGDMEAMAQAWCMIKPGGMFILAVPSDQNDECSIKFNSHRRYGTIRIKHLISNWNLTDERKCANAHKIFVLSRPDN